MTPERWLRLEELFDAAAEMASAERAAFLDQACAGDTKLRREVESLIISSEQEDDLINRAIRDAASVVADAERPQADGQTIGHYEVVREVGHGGMGTVYLAVRADDEYRKQVAIKLVRGGLLSGDVLRRFRSERQILATLDHSHIARLLDGGTTVSGSPYVVMEYVEGEPIDEYCDHHRLSTEARLLLFRKVCSAVQYAHQNLVVHRDIKPSNILVTADGEPKLLDFGIAKLLKSEPATQTVVQTRTNVRLMTPEYASPEQVRGESITTASDVYSLGVVLFELLTGHRPYRLKSYSPREIEQAICESAPEKPSTAVTRYEKLVETDNPPAEVTSETVSSHRGTTSDKLKRRLRGDLDNIVLMAMRKEPDRRYASADQLSEDIRRHLEGLPVVARPATFGYRAQKFIRRHRFGVAAAVVAFALIATLVGFYTWRLAGERDRARLEAEKAEKVSEFLAGLFEVSDPSQSKGETITAKELLKRGAPRIETELADQPEVQAKMMTVVGNVYVSLGLYNDAKPMLERALEIRRGLFNNEHPDVAQSLRDLGWLFLVSGDYTSAETLLGEALAMRRKLGGEEQAQVAQLLNDQATLSTLRGDYESAGALHRQVLALRQKLLGGEHPDVAESLFNLGVALNYTGDYGGAEAVLREALAVDRKLKGEDHPNVAHSISFLARILHAKGDYYGAEPLLREALALRVKLLGQEHPHVAQTLNDLGRLLQDMGDYNSAEPLFRQSLEMYRKQLGSDHPYVSLSLNNLAMLLYEKGEYEVAESLLREAIRIHRKRAGGNAQFGGLISNLAQVVHFKGDYSAAESLFEQAVSLRREQVGKDKSQVRGHRKLAETLTYQARLFSDQDKLQAAESNLREALDIWEKTDPGGNWSFSNSLVGLGSVLTARGDGAIAEPLIRRGVDFLRRALPVGHSGIADAESELGACLVALRRFHEAEPLLLESYRVARDVHGAKAKQTRVAIEHIVEFYRASGQSDRANQYRAMISH